MPKAQQPRSSEIAVLGSGQLLEGNDVTGTSANEKCGCFCNGTKQWRLASHIEESQV